MSEAPKKVLFTATLVRGHIAKFHIPYLKWFKEQGWETWVAARNDYPDGVCDIPFCDRFVDIPFARSPYSSKNYMAYKALKNLIKSTHFDLIHTHTPVGGVLTRAASRKARKSGTKVLYTAHGFHFCQGSPVINWLLWYPVEAFMSRFTDGIVTINEEDYRVARDLMGSKEKAFIIPSIGLDIRGLKATEYRSVRKELNCGDDSFFVLVVGDLTANKDPITALTAFAIANIPNSILVFCGVGPLQCKALDESKRLKINDKVRFCGHCPDIANYYKAANVLLFPSKREGFGMVGVEAMAFGLPVVASRIRGTTEWAIDGKTGFLCEPGSEQDFANALKRLADDSDLLAEIGAFNQAEAQKFTIEKSVAEMSAIYSDVLSVNFSQSNKAGM